MIIYCYYNFVCDIFTTIVENTPPFYVSEGRMKSFSLFMNSENRASDFFLCHHLFAKDLGSLTCQNLHGDQI